MKVNLLGVFFCDTQKRHLDIKLVSEMNVKNLINYLVNDLFSGEPELEMFRESSWEDYFMVTINRKIVKIDYVLQDGDEVYITPMFSGG